MTTTLFTSIQELCGGATSSTPVQCKLPLVGVCLTSVSLSDRASPSPSANAIHT